ncbi:MAG: HDOD domain-containing protein [Thermodesulfobacteriota bacterium]|nr:HDOD domain-containing protein [Thermodesulfobacteriota bacterium]
MNLLSESEIKKVLLLDNERLPSFPMAAARLLELSKDENASLKDFSKIVETDPAISVRVLEIVNSAMYGLQRKTTALSEAVAFLGMDEIKKLAIGMSIFKNLFHPHKNAQFNRLLFWRHCLSVAVLSMNIARECNYPEPEEAYLAGLLHDIGKIFLDIQGRHSYGDFIQNAARAHEPIDQIERTTLGLGHDDIGSYFCLKWKLPENLIKAVKYHHKPFGHKEFSREENQLISIIALADFLCWSQGIGSFDLIGPPVLSPDVETSIDMAEIDIVTCIVEMNREIDNISRFYNFAFPSSSQLQKNLLWTSLKLSKINTKYYYQKILLPDTEPESDDIKDSSALGGDLEFGKLLAKTGSINEILDIIMYQVGRMFNPLHWSILLKDPKTEEMIFSVVVGSNKKKLQGLRLPKGEGIAGHIMTTGDSLIVEKVEQDTRFSQRVDKYTGFTTESIIGTPLKTDQKIFGVIELINTIDQKNFTPRDLNKLSLTAEYAALAIEKFYYTQALKNMATRDSLTRLENRFSFDRTLANKIKIKQRFGEQLTLMVIQINGLWKITKTKGRLKSNETIKKTALVLSRTRLKRAVLFRYDEETFVVLMPGISKDKADHHKKNILNAFYQHVTDRTASGPDMEIAFFQIAAEDIYQVNSIVESSLVNSKQTIKEETAEKEEEKEAAVESMEAHLQPLVQEEREKTQPDSVKKGVYEKTVSLTGTFTHLKNRQTGSIWIKKLSLKSIRFKLSTPHNVIENTFLDIKFNLDDAKRSLVERRIVVRKIQNNYVEADFYNPPPYAKSLGFYFMN